MVGGGTLPAGDGGLAGLQPFWPRSDALSGAGTTAGARGGGNNQELVLGTHTPRPLAAGPAAPSASWWSSSPPTP